MNQAHQQPEWFTPAEAATYLRVKTRTVLMWARTGQLRGYVLSGTKRRAWRFRQVDLDANLESPSVLSETGRVS